MLIDTLISQGELTITNDNITFKWKHRTWEAKSMAELRLQLRHFMNRCF